MKERRRIVILAYAAAVILTCIGLNYTFRMKLVPQVPLALWFPTSSFACRFTDNDAVMLLAATLQFPLFAFVFHAVTNRCGVMAGLCVVMAIYLGVLSLAILVR